MIELEPIFSKDVWDTVTYNDIRKMRKTKTKAERDELLREYKNAKKAKNQEPVNNIPEEYRIPGEYDVKPTNEDVPVSLGAVTYRDLAKLRKAKTMEENADLVNQIKQITRPARFRRDEIDYVDRIPFDKRSAKILINDYTTNDIAFIKAYFANEKDAISDKVYDENHTYNVRDRQRRKTAKNAYYGNKRIAGDLKTALKLEKQDNERYNYVVNLDVDRVKLKSEADRDELYMLREEIIALLELRDEINRELCDI